MNRFVTRFLYPTIVAGALIFIPYGFITHRLFLVGAWSFCLAANTTWFLMSRKESRHGRDWRTEEDHPDPQASGTPIPYATGGPITLTASSSLSLSYEQIIKQMAASMPTFGVSTSELVAPQPGIDTVQEDMPILAHRAARLRSTRGGLKLAAINRKQGDELVTFWIDEDAVCKCQQFDTSTLTFTTFTSANLSRLLGSKHSVVPSLHGRCGWYAVPSDVDSWHDPGTVDLLVELSGTVIEHEKGYRAEHQRVIEVRLPGCWMCGDASTHALFDNVACEQFACADHLDPNMVAVTADTIRRRLGVPVVAVAGAK